ncbi:hypothetical protein TNCV_2391841 [Trichonephila clavipes]|nr:hypothetical protein TNCV_2391841 [Trichonephila clavipes]
MIQHNFGGLDKVPVMDTVTCHNGKLTHLGLLADRTGGSEAMVGSANEIHRVPTATTTNLWKRYLSRLFLNDDRVITCGGAMIENSTNGYGDISPIPGSLAEAGSGRLH